MFLFCAMNYTVNEALLQQINCSALKHHTAGIPDPIIPRRVTLTQNSGVSPDPGGLKVERAPADASLPCWGWQEWASKLLWMFKALVKTFMFITFALLSFNVQTIVNSDNFAKKKSYSRTCMHISSMLYLWGSGTELALELIQ